MISLRRFLLVVGCSLPMLLLTTWLASTYSGARSQQWQTGYETTPAESSPSPTTYLPVDSRNNDHHQNGVQSPKTQQSEQGPSSSLFVEQSKLNEVDCLALCDAMTEALQQGRVLDARYLALQVQNQYPQCEKTISEQYTQHSDAFLETGPPSGPLSRVAMDGRRSNENHYFAPRDDSQCWNPAQDDEFDLEDASSIVLDRWDICCSQVAKKSSVKSVDPEKECYHFNPQTMQRSRLCCCLYQGSLSHLRLPALQELSLNVRLKTSNTDTFEISIAQEGFLRKYDPAGVLWPTAYLLSMCIAFPDYCGIPELLEASRSHTSPVVSVELGAGVGLPSIAISRLLQQNGLLDQQDATPSSGRMRRVLATDRALHALALTTLNSQEAGVHVVVAHIQDHSNLTQLAEMKHSTLLAGGDEPNDDGKGYGIVLGSSLQSLFDFKTRDPRHKLWEVLDTLLDKSNTNAIAVLAHVVGAVIPSSPPSTGDFERIRKISGSHFGMMTRSGDDSDFEISVYRRRISSAAPTGEL